MSPSAGLSLIAALFVTGAAALATDVVAQQRCNPAIDGTYCDTQMPAKRYDQPSRSSSTTPMSSLGGDLSYSHEQPAAFGAIVIGGGRRCVLVMRERCN